MNEYIKLFQNHTQYETYRNSEDYIRPNVSYCEQQNEVHYNWVETRLVCKFNITDTSSATPIMDSLAAFHFSEIEIDGIIQPNVIYSYTFNTTGEHTVKYSLVNNTIIGGGAFYECTSLTSVIIPDSVTSIGSEAFRGCISLTSVIIPNSVTSIEKWAFRDCSNLTSITIPDSMNSIGNGSFQGCSSLTSIIIPNSVTSIGSSIFAGCSALTSAIIPNSMTLIGVDFFRNCSSLISITIPDTVTSIETEAFSGCSSLTSVSIGNSVISMRYGAFSNCTNLDSITIPSSVTKIERLAFSDCSNLASIICNATTAPTIEDNTFKNVKTGGKLTVPSGSTGYNIWMRTSNYYLGKYSWTKEEQ